ncbi:methyltransferase domain-containing protein [Sinorhizobium fredii]|uniref:methyltransferase domain-containing protein n=2 Tax=Rhizobium fredii TaxID=380 RepID=UPI0012FD262D|nr:methyltransferase domain-containing protein [Sinorhizobium fredii]
MSRALNVAPKIQPVDIVGRFRDLERGVRTHENNPIGLPDAPQGRLQSMPIPALILFKAFCYIDQEFRLPLLTGEYLPMPDPYSQITTVAPGILDVLIKAMELRAADPRSQAIRKVFLSLVDLPDAARVLEIGCGSGAITRELAHLPKVAEVVGLDPSPVFLAKARQLAAGIANLYFDEGDARSLPYADNEFDLAVFHTCLTHVPGPEKAVAEAFRVLRQGGHLAILDGDYSTTSVAVGDHDPLQACAEAAIAGLVNDRWLSRRLPGMVRSSGFHLQRLDSYGYLQADSPDYMLTLVDRGADILVNSSRIDSALADGLKKEARRRAESGEFFGFIAFTGLVARKPPL